jgi:hypothetical protein
VQERAYIWNGGNKRAHEIFNSLADGTYRWQPIVCSSAPVTSEKSAMDYLVCRKVLSNSTGSILKLFAVSAFEIGPLPICHEPF